MAILFKRLQAQSFRPYQSQQPLPFHGYKKLKFLSGLVGPRIFFGIIFRLIIIKKKQTELQTLHLVFFSKIMKKKLIFKLKTLEFFIVCSPH